MVLTDEQIRTTLSGRRILIVEDDPDLAPRLARLFRRYGTQEPVMKACAEGERNGGLEALVQQDPPFDLAVVYVRLPAD